MNVLFYAHAPVYLHASLTQHVYFFLENDVNHECTLYAHA
jgi:hypothetical protein